MKKSPKEQVKQREKILASCERTRQACNKLSEEERDRLTDEALRIIYGTDAKTTSRSR